MAHNGRLEPDPRWTGVFHVAGADIGSVGNAWAAVLASGGAVSYQSAGSRWDLPVDPGPWLHVTVPGRLRVDRRWGIRVHRVLLPPSSVTELDGLRVTTKTETIFDCLGALPPAAAMTLADRALQQGWFEEWQLRARLMDQPGRWGNVRLREILERIDPGVEAESERRFQALLRSAGVVGWTPQYEVTGPTGRRIRIDVAFPERRLAIEIDGRSIHNTHERFGADRQRQNDLVRLGWTVLRYMWDDITRRPHAILAEIRELLAA